MRVKAKFYDEATLPFVPSLFFLTVPTVVISPFMSCWQKIVTCDRCKMLFSGPRLEPYVGRQVILSTNVKVSVNMVNMHELMHHFPVFSIFTANLS